MSRVKGLSEVLKKLNALGDGIEKKVDAVTEGNARELEAQAKLFAPTNKRTTGGDLKQSIKAVKVGEIRTKTVKWKVFANATGRAPYAAYQEFGTGGMVSVPAELQDMAIKFKGRGIRKVNMRPQPYLYPALVLQRPIYKEELEDLLETETKKI